MILLFISFLSIFLVLVFYMLNFFLSFKFYLLSKNSSFESGFESIGKVHNSFSIHFFIIMLMFVIFDLEVVMLLGFLLSNYMYIINFFLILFFIMFGFYMEWYFGKLMWII
uniref:NADH dehydrogenase subunit 3 n=1 Tax=Halicephalobus mephisto TaxID=2559892 RepID=UPI002E77F793|nr:NADH dehydrogenase subunit 3 [Halicephalobus mephisto]WRI60235.1 NADH dehydrogenase subunit 3 [Halicephalobus mephisto]